MSKKAKADLLLLIVCLCWGASYYLTDICLEDMPPLFLNVFRFLVAFAVAGIAGYKRLKYINKETIKYAAIIGAALVCVYAGATYGVMYTSLSNAGFMCALTVVFTPIFAWIFKKQRPDKKLIFVVIMCTIGIALLTLNENLKPALGDIFCLLCAIAYAIDLLITETAVQKVEIDAFCLGVAQLGFTGFFMMILSLILETPTFPGSASVWGSAVFLAVFCTGLAFVVQAVAQQYTSASHVGVIFALEPVFSALVAFFLAGEVLTGRAYLGAVIMFIGMLIMETDFSSLMGKPQKR